MEENTLQPGAEEQKKPQTKKAETSEEKKAKAKKATSVKSKKDAKNTTAKKKATGAETPEETKPLEEVKAKENSKAKEEAKKTTAKKKATSAQTPEETKPKEEVKASKKVIARTKADEKAEDEEAPKEETNEVDYSKHNIEELIAAYTKLSTEEGWLKNHKSLQNISNFFEDKFKKEVEVEKKKFIDEGGNEIDFFFKPEYKKRFDQISFDHRKKRRNHFKDQEAAQKINLERRKAIIEEIKNLIDSNQINSQTYKSFRTLQESWYNTGQVPRSESQNLWETYKHHVERFYAFLHLDREFRELDYKYISVFSCLLNFISSSIFNEIH